MKELILTKKYNETSLAVSTEVEVENVDGILTAIWDTGATNSVVNVELVERMGLFRQGRRLQYTANGTRMAGRYIIDLIIDGVKFNNLEIIDGILHETDFLIGMDVITQGDFVITNYKGKTMMSYRRPSQQEIDFCKK